MTNLKHYMQDGANAQARAVLALLQDDIDEDREVRVSRWENCREQGYVISVLSPNFREQLNIAFFEHRNSDLIHAVKWQQTTINAPTIDTAKFGDIYKDKYDTSFSVGYREIAKMTKWIVEQIEDFLKENTQEDN